MAADWVRLEQTLPPRSGRYRIRTDDREGVGEYFDGEDGDEAGWISPDGWTGGITYWRHFNA
jgi:hypothetical protein